MPLGDDDAVGDMRSPPAKKEKKYKKEKKHKKEKKVYWNPEITTILSDKYNPLIRLIFSFLHNRDRSL